MAAALKFGATLCHEPRRRRLNIVSQALEELVPAETGRDRLEEFDHDRAGITQEGAAWPAQAGIERDRHAGHADLGIEMRDAELVPRLGPGGAARALRKDHELAAGADFLLGARGHGVERL